MTCVNTKDPEYLTLLKQSGIQEKVLKSYYQYFLDKYGRPPKLDELPNADSSEYIKETYDVKDGVVDTQK